MDMNPHHLRRLKFAHARGARIQYRGDDGRGWDTLIRSPVWSAVGLYRIHPDDAHLEYGPISAEIIDTAMYMEESLMGFAARDLATVMIGNYHERVGTHIEQQFFYLFAAEFLADEGL